MTSWLKLKLGGKMRVSTAVLLVAFLALFWVYHNVEPTPAAPQAPAPAVVPPGFVPDPNYTWVPRTNVRRPKETLAATTTTTTTTTSPTETTSPTSPTPTTPTTTVVDPDGFGPLPPTTQTVVTPTPVTTTPGPTPTTTAPTTTTPTTTTPTTTTPAS